MLKSTKINAAMATNIMRFCVRPFIIFYICSTIFLLGFFVILEGVLFWVDFKIWFVKNLDLNHVPRCTKCLLGKPDTSKFKNDITLLTLFHNLGIDEFLITVKNFGNSDTFACKLVVCNTWSICGINDTIG